MAINLLDILIAVFALGAVLSACHRGLGREVLHTTLFLIVVGGAIFFLRETPIPQGQAELSRMTVSILFFLIAVYAFSWGAVKFVAPLIMPREMRNVRSQFWAGALSAAKIAGMILGVNLWFALHSTEGSPLRLGAFPQMMQDSVFVRIADRTTDEVYRVLAEQKLVNPDDFNKKIANAYERDSAVLDSITSPTAPQVPDYEPSAGVADPLPEQRPESYE